jgi:hypothetical protein
MCYRHGKNSTQQNIAIKKPAYLRAFYLSTRSEIIKYANIGYSQIASALIYRLLHRKFDMQLLSDITSRIHEQRVAPILEICAILFGYELVYSDKRTRIKYGKNKIIVPQSLRK